MRKYLFTSESVTEGHPDKICDQISDAVLDAILAKDPQARVACETTCTTGMVYIMGEISTTCYVDIPKIARQVIRDIGYTDPQPGDIVVLTKEFDAARGPIVKRIIAVEGQTVDIDFVSGAVYVDGKTWSARSESGETLPEGTLVRAVRMEGVKLFVERLQ